MECRECRYLMSDWLEGKISPETTRKMEEHLADCSVCAERFKQLKQGSTEPTDTLGLFIDLLKPSGGFKRMFFAGSIMTIILFSVLLYLHFKFFN